MMATTRYRVERASARGLIGAESVLCFCDIKLKTPCDPCRGSDMRRCNGPGTRRRRTARTERVRRAVCACRCRAPGGSRVTPVLSIRTICIPSHTTHQPGDQRILRRFHNFRSGKRKWAFRGTTCVHAYSRASTSQHRTHATGTADPWADPAGGRRPERLSARPCPRVRACRLDRKIDECMQYADYRLDYMFS